jgi:hypothetical protein
MLRPALRLIAGTALVALGTVPFARAVQPGTSEATAGHDRMASRLAANFAGLAGSPANARALAEALHAGTEATLHSPAAGAGSAKTATVITPPTPPLGWIHVSHSLSLARLALGRCGIAEPANEQLKTVLVGGTLVAADGAPVAMRGILRMRADGLGWGQIAQAIGVCASAPALDGKGS